MPGVVHDFFHQPSFPNGAAIETISNNAWLVSSFFGTITTPLCPTLSPSNHACGAAEVLRKTGDWWHSPSSTHITFLPRNKACKAEQEGSMRLHCPRNTQNFTKEIFKKLRECLHFYPLNLFPPKSWENTPASFTWPRKNDSWKTSFLLGWPIFRGYVSSRGGYPIIFKIKAKVLEGKKQISWTNIFPMKYSQVELKGHFPVWHLWKNLWNSINLWGYRVEWIGPFRGVYWFANLREKIHGFFRKRRGIVW